MTAVYVLEGARITSLEDFWRLWLEAVGSDGRYFGRNFGAFDDALRGGPGMPETDDDYIVEWREHEQLRARLGQQFWSNCFGHGQSFFAVSATDRW